MLHQSGAPPPVLGDEQAICGPVLNRDFSQLIVSLSVRSRTKTARGFAVRRTEGTAERRDRAVASPAGNCREWPVGFAQSHGSTMQPQPREGCHDGFASDGMVQPVEVKRRETCYFSKMLKIQIGLEIFVDVSHHAINPLTV